MGSVTVSQILVTPLEKIATAGGDVMHGIKQSDIGYAGFGEAYFSLVEFEFVKAWKRHERMTLNLVVPVGEVRFIFIDADGLQRTEVVGFGRYVRLTVPPGIWFGFQGLSAPYSVVLNVADITHDPDEVRRKEIDFFDVRWERVV